MKKLLLLLIIPFLSFGQSSCILDGGLAMNPAPSPDPNFTGQAVYPPETTVVMCFTVEQYNTSGTQNWMHGIVPLFGPCLLYTSPSPRDGLLSRMPSSA